MNLEHRKFLRPNEVEEIYGIKVGTLAKQRNQGFGLPYVIIGRKPKKRKTCLWRRLIYVIVTASSPF